MSFESVVAADNPIRWWKLEETSGTTVTDEIASAVGNVLGGTDLNVADGAVGSAVNFDGVNGRIEMAPAITARPCTIEGFIRIPVDNQDWHTIYAQADNTQADRTLQAAVGEGLAEGSIRADSAYAAIRGVTPIDDGQWHHVVVTFVTSSSNTAIKVYVDGGLDGSGTLNRGYPLGINDAEIGRLPRSSPVDITNGDIDEVILYDYELTLTQVEEHYEAWIAVAQDLNVGFHQQTTSIFTPVIENQEALNLNPARLESTAQFFAPTIESQTELTLNPSSIASTVQIFTPTLQIGSQTLNPDFIASTALLFTPTLTSESLDLNLSRLESTVQIFSPTLTSEALELTGLPIINSTVQLFSPTIWNEGSQVFEPTLVGNGSLADQIMNGLIDQGFLTGSLADREQQRLLAKLGLAVSDGYSIQDLYFLANEENRLAGEVTV